MELKFKEYSSIENVERTKDVNAIISQGQSGGEWVVTEKIHGANFSFWITENGIQCASRNGMLEEGNIFFNYHDVRDRHAESLMKIYNHQKTLVESTGNIFHGITVYGEMFGGSYPHPEVERTFMAMRVQKGVFYHPGNCFAAFDITLHFERTTENKMVHMVLNHDLVYELCTEYELPHVPVLFLGTFQECLEYPNEFQSHVPAMLGLPLIEDNICEGVVIRPVQPKFYWRGGRIILKNKNAKWSEKAKKQKTSKDENSANKFEFELSEDAVQMQDEILAYVTENRLKNVLSKMEKITDKDFGRIVGLMNRDVIEDFLKDNKEQFMSLVDRERKFLTKRMGLECTILIRNNFIDILDGEF